MYLVLTRFLSSDQVRIEELETESSVFHSLSVFNITHNAPFEIKVYSFDEDNPTQLGKFLFSIKNYQDEKVS